MSTQNEYQSWIQDKVVTAFKIEGINITGPAIDLLAYMLQSQRQEGVVGDDQQLFQLAAQLLVEAPRIYVKMFGSDPVTVNRALHLLVALNRTYNFFPSGTSD